MPKARHTANDDAFKDQNILMVADTCETNDEDNNSWEPLLASSGAVRASASSAVAVTVTSSSWGKLYPNKLPTTSSAAAAAAAATTATNKENLVVTTTRRMLSSSSNNKSFSPIFISLRFAYHFLPQMCLQNPDYIFGYCLVASGTILHALSFSLYLIRNVICSFSPWLLMLIYLPLISTSILYQWHTAVWNKLILMMQFNTSHHRDHIGAIVKSCHILGTIVWILPAFFEVHTYYCISTALSQCELCWFHLISCTVVASCCYYYYYYYHYCSAEATPVRTMTLSALMTNLRFILHLLALVSLLYTTTGTTTTTLASIIHLLPFVLLFIGSFLQRRQAATTWLVECTRHAVRLTIRDGLQELLLILANNNSSELPVEEMLQLVMIRWIVEYWTTIASSTSRSRRSSTTYTSASHDHNVDDVHDGDKPTQVYDDDTAATAPVSVLGWEEMRSMISTTTNVMMEEVAVPKQQFYNEQGDIDTRTEHLQNPATMPSLSSRESPNFFSSIRNESAPPQQHSATVSAPSAIRSISGNVRSSFYSDTNISSSSPFTNLQSMLCSFDVDRRARPAVLAYKHSVNSLAPSRNAAFTIALLIKLPCCLALLLRSFLFSKSGVLSGTLPLLPSCVLEVYLVYLWVKTATVTFTPTADDGNSDNNIMAYLLPRKMDSIDIMFTSIGDDDNDNVLLKKHAMLFAYRNMQRSIEALEMGLLVTRAAQTTALAMGFASSIIHLTELRHELSQGWFHGLRVLITELLEYQELQKQKDMSVTFPTGGMMAGRYATAAHIMIHNSQLVANNMAMIQQDHPIVSEVIACATGVVGHALFAAAGRGWLWGREEELPNLDDKTQPLDDDTNNNDNDNSYSEITLIRKGGRSSMTKNDSDDLVEISVKSHTYDKAQIGSEKPSIASTDQWNSTPRDTLHSELPYVECVNPAQQKNEIRNLEKHEKIESIQVSQKRLVYQEPDLSRSHNNKGEKDDEEDDQRVLGMQKASNEAGLKIREDQFECYFSKTEAIEKQDVQLCQREAVADIAFSNKHQCHITPTQEGGDTKKPKENVRELPLSIVLCHSVRKVSPEPLTTKYEFDENNTKASVGGDGASNTRTSNADSVAVVEYADLSKDALFIKSLRKSSDSLEDDDHEEDTFGWTHVSRNSVLMNAVNVDDEDNWQTLTPSMDPARSSSVPRQVTALSEADPDLPDSSGSSLQLNPISFVWRVLSPDRLTRRRSNSAESSSAGSQSSEWGKWVGGGLAVVGAVAVGAVSLSAKMNGTERMNKSNREDTFRIEELDDDVAEEIVET